MTTSQKSHKNKTLACFLAALTGSLGLHRFYLYGKKDSIGWLHASSFLASSFLTQLFFNLPILATWSPFIVSALIAVIEALVIGLTNDEKWDQQHNLETGKKSNSSWLLAVLLVATTACGASGLILVIARAFDLYYTGGAYG